MKLEFQKFRKFFSSLKNSAYFYFQSLHESNQLLCCHVDSNNIETAFINYRLQQETAKLK